ncbi:MAG: hypothetical protein IPM55_06645 [Acidobacteria bacterium]|nr:hypothetical protein [Acidobacteriota bacterium]
MINSKPSRSDWKLETPDWKLNQGLCSYNIKRDDAAIRILLQVRVILALLRYLLKRHDR